MPNGIRVYGKESQPYLIFIYFPMKLTGWWFLDKIHFGFRVRCARVWHLIWIGLLFCTLCQSKGWACCRKTFALHMKYWHPTASRMNQKEFCGSEAPMQIRDWERVRKSDIFNATIINLMKCQISFSYLLMEETPWNTFSLCGLSPKPEKANVFIWCSVLIQVYHKAAWFFLSVSHTT